MRPHCAHGPPRTRPARALSAAAVLPERGPVPGLGEPEMPGSHRRVPRSHGGGSCREAAGAEMLVLDLGWRPLVQSQEARWPPARG